MANERIVFFGSQISTGGAQQVLLDQAGWFHAHGYDVLALFYYDKDGLLESWQAKSPFPIQTLSSYTKGKSLQNGLNLIPAANRFCKILREFHPQVITCFTHDANLIGLPLAACYGVPRRFGTHHGQFAGLSAFKTKLHTQVINSRKATGLICVSQRAKNQALSEGVHPEKITVIPNGITPIQANAQQRAQARQQLGLRESDFMVLTVGRLVPEKAQQKLVEAAAILSNKNAAIRFFIAGDGPEKEHLQRQIRQNALDETFTLLGNRTDVPALLNAADLFVLYSETEGMPLSLMEAMSTGLPVIASDLEGTRELIGDNEFGRLIPFGDANALADEIQNLSRDAAAREKLGITAASRIKADFSQEKSCLAYEKLFRGISE